VGGAPRLDERLTVLDLLDLDLISLKCVSVGSRLGDLHYATHQHQRIRELKKRLPEPSRMTAQDHADVANLHAEMDHYIAEQLPAPSRR
jgi:hypothetical protein